MKHTLSLCAGLFFLLFSFSAASQGVVVPKLIGSSYSGANVQDVGTHARADADGNMYLIGWIYGESTGQLVATPGVVQPEPSDAIANVNVNVIKFNQDLSGVLSSPTWARPSMDMWRVLRQNPAPAIYT